MKEMSENNKFESKHKNIDLKGADSQKKDSVTTSNPSVNETKNFQLPSNSASAKQRKKKTPIFADVVAGILIILIAVGVVVGAVYLFRYQTNDYGTVEAEYQMIVYPEKDDSFYITLKNKSIFVDSDDNSIYVGKLTDIQFSTDEKGDNVLILTVSAKVKYREGDGYSINDCRLTVGSEYTVRSESIVMDGVIVELDIDASEGGQ